MQTGILNIFCFISFVWQKDKTSLLIIFLGLKPLYLDLQTFCHICHIKVTRLCHNIYNLHGYKSDICQKKYDIFPRTDPNIDSGYSLWLPQIGSSNEYIRTASRKRVKWVPTFYDFSKYNENNLQSFKPNFSRYKEGITQVVIAWPY